MTTEDNSQRRIRALQLIVEHQQKLDSAPSMNEWDVRKELGIWGSANDPWRRKADRAGLVAATGTGASFFLATLAVAVFGVDVISFDGLGDAFASIYLTCFLLAVSLWIGSSIGEEVTDRVLESSKEREDAEKARDMPVELELRQRRQQNRALREAAHAEINAVLEGTGYSPQLTDEGIKVQSLPAALESGSASTQKALGS